MKDKIINPRLSYQRCREMVCRCEAGSTPQEMRRRCNIAMEWLTDNVVISMQQYDELMQWVASIIRDSYHWQSE